MTQLEKVKEVIRNSHLSQKDKDECYKALDESSLPEGSEAVTGESDLKELLADWRDGKYPDFSHLPPQEKSDLIFGCVQIFAKEIMMWFYACGLKTHIECVVINAPTNEQFKFSFVKLPADPTPSSSGKTVGMILSEAIRFHELNPEVVEKEIGLSDGLLRELMRDEFYTNSVPFVLFKNLLMSLHIPFSIIEPAMLPTFKVIQAKETPETIKKKPNSYLLWENEESVIKYTNRLKELMVSSSGKEAILNKYPHHGFDHSVTRKDALAAMDSYAASLIKENEELKERIKKLEFMIDKGLGWDDMKNDNT